MFLTAARFARQRKVGYSPAGARPHRGSGVWGFHSILDIPRLE